MNKGIIHYSNRPKNINQCVGEKFNILQAVNTYARSNPVAKSVADKILWKPAKMTWMRGNLDKIDKKLYWNNIFVFLTHYNESDF